MLDEREAAAGVLAADQEAGAEAAELAEPDPEERLRGVVAAFYAWSRETESMRAKVLRDAEHLPAMAELMAGAQAQQEALVDALAAAFGARGACAKRVRAAVVLALDFWAWRALAHAGLSDEDAADVVTGAVRAAATPPGRR